jgi:MFS family permease
LPGAGQASAYLGLTLSAERKRRPWVALRNSGFRLYFAGSVISDLGTWVQNTAQVLLAYRLTHSLVAVGLVTCAQFSSPLVLGPWAGVMTDRFGGRKTLIGTEIVATATAALLAYGEFGGKLSEPWLVAGAIMTGLTFTFALPARNVTVRRLVSDEDVKVAYAMDSVSYNLGRAVAPPLAVILVTTAGFGWAFTANAVSFLAFTVVLSFVSRGKTEPERRSRVRDGFLIAWRQHRIMIILLMVAAVTVADDPVLVLGPALARHFGASASWSGWFIAALGAGSVLGSIRRSKHKPSLRLAATALFLLGICMVIFVWAPNTWISVTAAAGAGIACLVVNSSTRTLLAKEAGPAKESSVMAVWAIAWAGSKPVASLLDGFLASRIGIHWTGFILALPALLPMFVLLLLPALLMLPGLGHRLSRSKWLTHSPGDTPSRPADSRSWTADSAEPALSAPRLSLAPCGDMVSLPRSHHGGGGIPVMALFTAGQAGPANRPPSPRCATRGRTRVCLRVLLIHNRRKGDHEPDGNHIHPRQDPLTT